MDNISSLQVNQTDTDPNVLDAISWTPQELQEWVKAGLIPLELFEPSRTLELTEFLRKNKKMLHAHSHRNFEEDRYVMSIPPPDEWHKAPDITVTDKITGETSILEMAGYFNLCEGIRLRIKAKELPEWEKDTAAAKDLNKDQHETLKATLEKIGYERPLSRDKIVKIIEEVRKPQRKPKKYRQSGHLVDQKLKYNLPKSQPSLFDSLMTETKQKIEEVKVVD